MLVVKRIKIKGYASIQTNFGNINIELYTDYAPKTVYNFVKLSQQGYYNNTIFHTLEEQEPVKKKGKAGGFGNFDGW